MITPEKISNGTVVEEIHTRKRLVIGAGVRKSEVESNPDKYNFVSDVPHHDQDYSYICGNDYCKCMQ